MNNQHQGPPPKIQKLDIRAIYEEVKNSNLNTRKDKINFLKKYKYIEQDYNFLYNIIINNDLKNGKSQELQILNFMLSKIDDINDKKVSKKKGEEEVGQVLVDTYVKPMLDKKKEEEKKKEEKKKDNKIEQID
tara:strand:- start:29 stop:427 length:399 start_codon:yes stop_codon:yes gene_type:complete